MNFELVIGIFCIFFGILTLIGRIFKIEKMFNKLNKMKEFWGDRAGSIIHFIGYTVIPIIIGIVLIIKNI